MIDRREEKERLELAAEQAPELVVMRGRRRVGKSYLLNHSFEGKRVVYFQADEGGEQAHLDLFAAAVGELAGAPIAFDDWESAFSYLATLAAAQPPLVVVLDEYQWLRQAQPRLDSVIMRHFDRWKREDVKLALVLSGSAMSLMAELLEGDKPMFGRASYRPVLEPFDFRDASSFAPEGSSSEAKLRRYAMLGGTPQYQAWAGRAPFATVLKERVLRQGESLFEEPLELIRGEDQIREPGNYFSILRAIAQGATRAVEIETRTKISSGQLLRKRLENLERLSYIEERRTLGGTGTVRWEIADPFFAFWFRYVFPNRSRLSQGRIEEVADAVLADFDNYMGWAFERVCRQWAARYADFDEFRQAEQIGSYWTRTHDTEIDLVARARDRYLALGSCKWSKRADAHALDDLLAARERVRGASDASLFMFARGFHPALVKRADEEGVRLINLDHLFGEGRRLAKENPAHEGAG